MVLYPILLSQSWSTTVPNFMPVSGIAQSGQRGSFMVLEINIGVCPRLEFDNITLLIVWGMTFIFMVHLSFYAIPLLIYDVMYDITTIP